MQFARDSRGTGTLCARHSLMESLHYISKTAILQNGNGWRPIFIIALYVIVLWRDFNCVKIPKARQINPRIAGVIYAPKVE